MKKVVFIGSKKIGYNCLKILHNNQSRFNYRIEALLTNKKGESIKNYALKKKIRILKSLDDVLTLKRVDIIISVQFHKILNKFHINKAKELAINLHMAPLPEYRGSNQFSLAIIENKKIFGITIHKIDEGIDTGDILFEDRFKIPKNIWVEELYDLAYKKSIKLFRSSIKDIINLNFNPKPQKNLEKKRGASFHYRNEINKLKEINLSWSKKKIEKYIRATSKKGFEKPFVIIKGTKVYFNRFN